MWHVFILNRYLKRYVTEMHDSGSDTALQVCHIHRGIGGWDEPGIYIILLKM